MSTLQTIVLALIQGLTEFLPISSSAHLILPSQLLGWDDQGIAFDIAVHVGTLFAVIMYFRREVSRMTISWLRSLNGQHSLDSKLAWQIVYATIPILIIGLFSKNLIEQYTRSIVVIGIMTIIFGFFLWWADKKSSNEKNEYQASFKDAFIIGLSQAIALIPGTSRSGITMTTAMMLGMTRVAAARFSFLMSIPVIAIAGAYNGLKLLQSPDSVNWLQIGLGIMISCVSALFCIHWLLKLLQRVSMFPFMLYRLILGIGLLTYWLVKI